MKIYNLKEAPKRRNRVKIIIPILIFIVLNAILFPIFYFVLSEGTDLFRSIITSLAVSILVTIDNIIRQVIRYEKKTIVIDKNNIYLVIVQDETTFYYTDVKRKIDLDFNDKKVIEDIINNLDNYIGISLFKVDNYQILKKKDNSISIQFNGERTKWKYKEENKKPKYVLISKKQKIKMHLDDKYDNIKEMIEYFTK